MTRDLTTRQQALLVFIAEQCAGGRPPTIREMCDHVGAKSPNTVFERLEALETRGLLARRGEYAAARARYPTPEGYRVAGVAPTGRITTYGELCTERPYTPSPHLADRLVVVTNDSAWLLGEQLVSEIP